MTSLCVTLNYADSVPLDQEEPESDGEERLTLMPWDSLIVAGAVIWATGVVLSRGIALFRSFWWATERTPACGSCGGCSSSRSDGLVTLAVASARPPRDAAS